jgi:hypothetical protein
VLPLWVPGGMCIGGLLPTEPGSRGKQSFDQWIDEHFATAGAH